MCEYRCYGMGSFPGPEFPHAVGEEKKKKKEKVNDKLEVYFHHKEERCYDF